MARHFGEDTRREMVRLVSGLINVPTFGPGLAQQVEEFIFGFELAERATGSACDFVALNPPSSKINSISSPGFA